MCIHDNTTDRPYTIKMCNTVYIIFISMYIYVCNIYLFNMYMYIYIICTLYTFIYDNADHIHSYMIKTIRTRPICVILYMLHIYIFMYMHTIYMRIACTLYICIHDNAAAHLYMISVCNTVHIIYIYIYFIYICVCMYIICV